MAKYRVFSVGFSFPGGVVDQIPLNSTQSLLDADIVVFEPTLAAFYADDAYQGKPLLSESSSFHAKEAIAHWRSELKAAYDAGRIIFVYLSKPLKYFVHTGEREYSGTGRNQKVTNIVEPLSSYSSIPFELATTVASGKRISYSADEPHLSGYWNEFAADSPYEVCIEGEFTDVLLTTRQGNRIVGAKVTARDRGTLIFLPPISYDEDEFTDFDEEREIEIWNAAGEEFGHKLVSALVGVADSIKSSSAVTPPPDWTQNSEYRLIVEASLRNEIAKTTKQIQTIASKKADLESQLREAGSLRRLLYEKGPELENAVIEALNLMHFHAAPYKDENSEFDVVFESQEGRFIGEVEGKDSSAVNIDKLSQLERNIQEDFARDDINAYADGVLFGNPERIKDPATRSLSFTEKVMTGAKRSGIRLVLTKDLFIVARHLRENEDNSFADECRQAIANATGQVVKFPKVPEASQEIKEASSDPAESS